MKDFIDIAYLSSYYSLNDMIKFYNEKYEDDMTFSILKSIVYFDDIEETDSIIVFEKNYSFDKVRKRLIEMVEKPDVVLMDFKLV